MTSADDLSPAQQRMLAELREHRTIEVDGRTRRTAQALIDGGFAEPVRVNGGELTGIRLPESLVAAPAEATPTPDPEPDPQPAAADDGPPEPTVGLRFHPRADPDAVWRVTKMAGGYVHVRYSDTEGAGQGYASRRYFLDKLAHSAA